MNHTDIWRALLNRASGNIHGMPGFENPAEYREWRKRMNLPPMTTMFHPANRYGNESPILPTSKIKE